MDRVQNSHFLFFRELSENKFFSTRNLGNIYRNVEEVRKPKYTIYLKGSCSKLNKNTDSKINEFIHTVPLPKAFIWTFIRVNRDV